MASLVPRLGCCATLRGVSTGATFFFDCARVNLDAPTQFAGVVCVVDSMTLRVVVMIVALV